MTQTDVQTADAAVFRALLQPHRSLTANGFLVLMVALSIVCFITGMAFLWIGAWPVTGFFGLDVLLVYVAFKLNYQAARAYETVEVTPSLLRVEQVAANGKTKLLELNPYWVTVRVEEQSDGSAKLKLASHGSEYSVAESLSDGERREFAAVLREAIARARLATAG